MAVQVIHLNHGYMPSLAELHRAVVKWREVPRPQYIGERLRILIPILDEEYLRGESRPHEDEQRLFMDRTVEFTAREFQNGTTTKRLEWIYEGKIHIGENL
jgi:hypothetical protein